MASNKSHLREHSHPGEHPNSNLGEHPNSNLEREFELERMILFTDAVFAIAITLLVIDIKWPDLADAPLTSGMLHLLKGTIWQFLAFLLSFVLIGQYWATHLQLFRLLRTYDQGLIKRNLLFLFFIVTFPFAAAGLAGHVQTNFLLPVFVYMFNLSFSQIAHFLLCRYVFYQKPGLTVEGKMEEKKFLYIRARYTAISITVLSLLLLILTLIFPEYSVYIAFGPAVTGGIFAFINRRTRKYKPKTADVGN
jgi:uncharacterized membrane protein